MPLLTSSCLSVRPSLCFRHVILLQLKLGSWGFFSKICCEDPSFIEIRQNNSYFTLTLHRCILLRTRRVSENICRKHQHPQCIFNNFFLFKNRAVYGKMWKTRYRRTDYRLQYITEQKNAICMPDNWGKNADTHSYNVILVTFSTSKMGTRTRLKFTLYVHCLSRLQVMGNKMYC